VTHQRDAGMPAFVLHKGPKRGHSTWVARIEHPRYSTGRSRWLVTWVSHGGVTSCRWDLGPEAVYARRAAGKVPQNYSYEAPVRAGAVVQATVTTVKANVTVPYSGNLTVTLASSAVISIPVTGVFEGESYTPLVCSPSVL
jgi:hypothetical protein